MAFIKYNENPYKNDTIDCVIRGIAKFLDLSWDDVYIDLMVEGFVYKEVPHRNYVWDSYLRNKGFYKVSIPDTCPEMVILERLWDIRRDTKSIDIIDDLNYIIDRVSRLAIC